MKISDPRKYFQKKVSIVCYDGEKYTGVVDVYAYAKDNDGVAGFALSDIGLWIDENEIQSIEILDEE
jgi:hypothetical protein